MVEPGCLFRWIAPPAFFNRRADIGETNDLFCRRTRFGAAKGKPRRHVRELTPHLELKMLGRHGNDAFPAAESSQRLGAKRAVVHGRVVRSKPGRDSDDKTETGEKPESDSHPFILPGTGPGCLYNFRPPGAGLESGGFWVCFRNYFCVKPGQEPEKLLKWRPLIRDSRLCGNEQNPL